MKAIGKAIVELLKVKSLITLAIIGALVYLAVTGTVEIAVFTSIASSILTYYFTKKDDKVEEDEKNPEELIEKIVAKALDKKQKYIIEEENVNEHTRSTLDP